MNIDHEGTRNIVCPYCGYEHGDSWEISGNEESSATMECQQCEKNFYWECSVSVTYTTEKP